MSNVSKHTAQKEWIFLSTGKQRYRCCTCGRQFVENPENKIIPEHTWILVDKLLLERVPISGISRVTGISEPWLQKYINEKYDNLDKQIQEPVINDKKKSKLKSNVMKCDLSSKINNGFGYFAHHYNAALRI